MSCTSSPAVTPGTASPAAENADGYLLLTIQHAQVKQVYDEQTMVLARGELRLECVPLPIPAEIGHQTANPFSPSPSDPATPTHDFWLVLRVGPTFEMPLIPQQESKPLHDTEGITYSVASPNVPNASLLIILPLPSSSTEMKDLESFEVLLRQYKSLGPEVTALANVSAPPLGSARGPPMAEELRGRLMLVNEDNGEVVGELDQEFDMDEDTKLSEENRNKPVMLDFGEIVNGYQPVVKVQTVPQDELDDWMLKGAHNISKGILSFSSWSSKMISSGADMYIRNSVPRAEPVKFSPSTKAGIRRAHNASVKTVNVTKSTVGMINKAISTVVEKTYDVGVAPVVDTYNSLYSEGRSASMSGDKPPIPTRPVRPTPPASPRGSSSPSIARSPPPLPPRDTSALGETVSLPDQRETLLAEMIDEKSQPPTYSGRRPSEAVAIQDAPRRGSRPVQRTLASNKRPFFNRLLLAGEVVLTSLEATTHVIINSSTAAASSAAGHKYGAEAGHATALLGGSVRNVAVVYIDVRGVGRRAFLKSSAKGFVKARLKNGEVVKLQGEGREGDGLEVEAGEVEREDDGAVVMGMPEVGRSTALEGREGEKGLTRR